YEIGATNCGTDNTGGRTGNRASPPPVLPMVTVRFANWEQLGLPFNRMATSADARMAEPAGGLAGVLYAVAGACPLPQVLIAVTKPVCVTLTVPGTSVAQVTAWVMSLVSGGWM